MTRPTRSHPYSTRSKTTGIRTNPAPASPPSAQTQVPIIHSPLSERNFEEQTDMASEQDANPVSFSEPKVAGRKRKAAELDADTEQPQQSIQTGAAATRGNQRKVKRRVETAHDPQAPIQMASGKEFATAIEHATTRSGDAFKGATDAFLRIPVASRECVTKYMLGCKILAQYAKVELRATETSVCQLFWKGLGGLESKLVAARKAESEALISAILSQSKLCAFDADTPREVVLKSAEISRIDFRGQTKSPEKVAARAIHSLGLGTPLKAAQAAKDFAKRQDKSWRALLEELQASESAGPVASQATPPIETASQREASLVYRLGSVDVKGNSPAGKVVRKLLECSLTRDDAESYLCTKSNSPEEYAIYARIFTLLMLYFGTVRNEEGDDGSEVFIRGARALSNDLLRAKQQARDLSPLLAVLKSELNGGHVPLKCSEIVFACMASDRRAKICHNMPPEFRSLLDRAKDIHTERPISAARLTYPQMLDLCVPQAALGMPTVISTTTTTVTTLESTTATSTTTSATSSTTDRRDEDIWKEPVPAAPAVDTINWAGEIFDWDNAFDPESLPDEFR